MRLLLLTGLILLSLLGATLAETVIVTEPWVRVRSRPEPHAKAIGIVYGNDTLEVTGHSEGWFRIRTTRGIEGWIAAEDAYPVTSSIAGKALAYAQHLEEMGRERSARTQYIEIIRRYRGSPQALQATRHMLNYHPVGDLPEIETGEMSAGQKSALDKLVAMLLIAEGNARLDEGRYREAAVVFEDVRAGGRFNRTAMIGIGRALLGDLKIARETNDPQRIQAASTALKDYFPNYGESEFETAPPPPIEEPEVEEEEFPGDLEKRLEKKGRKRTSAGLQPDPRPFYGPVWVPTDWGKSAREPLAGNLPAASSADTAGGPAENPPGDNPEGPSESTERPIAEDQHTLAFPLLRGGIASIPAAAEIGVTAPALAPPPPISALDERPPISEPSAD